MFETEMKAIESVKKSNREMCKTNLSWDMWKTTLPEDIVHKLEKLESYEKLDDERRMFVTPCAIGTKVYMKAYEDFGKDAVDEYTVAGFNIRENGVWLMSLEIEYKGRIFNRTVETEKIGKTIFFSKEEIVEKLNIKLDKCLVHFAVNNSGQYIYMDHHNINSSSDYKFLTCIDLKKDLKPQFSWEAATDYITQDVGFYQAVVQYIGSSNRSGRFEVISCTPMITL